MAFGECWILTRVCYACGSNHTRLNTNRIPCWHLNHDTENNILCMDCFVKIIHYPSRRNIVLDQHKQYIRFKDKRIKLQSNPRTGICSICKQKALTHMHHWFYMIIMPWSCIVELCNKCHPKQMILKRDPNGRFKGRLESAGF